VSVYHLELRRFPKSLTRYNLSGAEVGAIVLPWVQERVIELDEQKWSPHEATITILEGPSIPIERLSMGRGWRTAQREGRDVTELVLAEARQAIADGSAPAGPAGGEGAPVRREGQALAREGGQMPSAGDPLELAVELGALLGEHPARLLSAWRAVAARASGLTPSATLALAERELGADAPPPG
jgi:hypothetical protein